MVGEDRDGLNKHDVRMLLSVVACLPAFLRHVRCGRYLEAMQVARPIAEASDGFFQHCYVRSDDPVAGPLRRSICETVAEMGMQVGDFSLIARPRRERSSRARRQEGGTTPPGA